LSSSIKRKIRIAFKHNLPFPADYLENLLAGCASLGLQDNNPAVEIEDTASGV
jgi:hypothetical protein